MDKKETWRESLVKTIIENDKKECISLDIEHGGHKYGITLFLVVLFCKGGFEESDMKYDLVYKETFNEYVKPKK